MSPQLAAAYEQALHAAEPMASMRQIVQGELRRNGGDRAAVLAGLEEIRPVVRAGGGSEDAILDLMDYVSGWCSPHMKLST